jgi:hypothetical protein
MSGKAGRRGLRYYPDFTRGNRRVVPAAGRQPSARTRFSGAAGEVTGTETGPYSNISPRGFAWRTRVSHRAQLAEAISRLGSGIVGATAKAYIAVRPPRLPHVLENVLHHGVQATRRLAG